MTIKYLHVRAVDEDQQLLPTGGITVAYTVTGKDIVAAWVKCRPDELFCFATGRKEAEKKLSSPNGEFEVLPLDHPISATLVDWLATVVWPMGPESRGMGHAIDIWWDGVDEYRGRWISDFAPSQLHVNFTPDEALDASVSSYT